MFLLGTAGVNYTIINCVLLKKAYEIVRRCEGNPGKQR